jgi:hypothetical protein
MGHIWDASPEDKLQLDIAVSALEESSTRLIECISSGSTDTLESAFLRFKLSKAQFSLARAVCRNYQLHAATGD